MILDEAEGWISLLHQHLHWYPLMELRDIYKLLYQGILGPEHMIANRQEYTRRLRNEFKRIHPDPLQRLLEPIQPDHSLFRLNLRAYKSRRPEVDLLVPLLLATSRKISATEYELLRTWSAFVQWCEKGLIQQFKSADLETFSRWLEQQAYPAVHHSKAYRREYQPAYRLISALYTAELGFDVAG